MLRRGFNAGPLVPVWGPLRNKGSNSWLWVWVEEASVQDCECGQWVQGGGRGEPGLSACHLWECGLVWHCSGCDKTLAEVCSVDKGMCTSVKA